ncbi:unnamed protein product [Closterium sp. Yama58-4]|nr:unnamed protein product [Closterium sp. Yama58-4]
MDFSISVDPQQPLQSAFDRLFQSHLPHCCLPSKQQDNVDKASDQKDLTKIEKQAVRFMALGQVAYLSPEASAEKAKLKAGTVIKVLPVKSREGGKGKPDSAVAAGGSSSSSSGVANHTPASAPASAPPSAPASAPASASVSAPASAPASVPASARACPPASAPASTPASAHASAPISAPVSAPPAPTPATNGGHSSALTSTSRRVSSSRRIRPSITSPLGYSPISRPHMVHHVDVNLPWNHSLCACCLSRILHPAPPITYQTSTLNALRLHLQQPVSEKINPCQASHNRPSQAILAYSTTVRVPRTWSMTGPGVGRGGSSRTALASAAARGGGGGDGGGISRFDVPSGSPAVQFKWKADFAPMPAAEGMLLEWMAEPRVGLLWDLDVVRCQLAQADIMGIGDLADASGAATTAAATAARATTSRASNTTGATAATASKHFWWCCWQCSACWAAYRRCLAMVVFLVLLARLPRAVTLWRLHMRSCYNVFPALANLLNVGRQIEGMGGRLAERQASRQAGKGGGKQASGNAEEDCFGSILVQVLGVKGKKELESGFAAHVLPLLPGGRRAHGGMRGGAGSGGGGGGRRGGTGSVKGEEWREGLRGVEWDEYVEQMGEIISHGGLEAEKYRCSCRQCGGDNEGAGGSGDSAAGNGGGTASGMVITGVDPTDFSLRTAFTLCMPRFAIYGVMAFTGACSNRYKERVEDAAVEAARQRLAEKAEGAERAEESGKGSPWLNPPSYCTRTNPEAPALALPHPAHDLPSLLVRFGAIPKPAGTAGSEACGGGVSGWEEFPVGDRDALKAHGRGSALGGREGVGGVEKGTAGLVNGEFLGVNTFQTGSFRDSVLDRDEMLKEFNVGAAQGLQENGAVRSAATTSAAEGLQEYRAARALSDSSMDTPAFPTLADRVEEFLRRFSPKRLAKEGRAHAEIPSGGGRFSRVHGGHDHPHARLQLLHALSQRVQPVGYPCRHCCLLRISPLLGASALLPLGLLQACLSGESSPRQMDMAGTPSR